MSKAVDLQLRKVPTALRDRLRKRARGKGKTMSRYVIELLEGDLERPTMAEWLDEIMSLPSVALPKGVTGATLVREAREERERELGQRMDRIMRQKRVRSS